METGEAAGLLKSRDLRERIRAVQALGRAGTAEARALLLQAMGDRSHYVAAMAAERLRDARDPECAAAMLARFGICMADGMKRDPGCHIRAALAIAFGRMGYAPAVTELRAGLLTVQIEPVGLELRDTGAHLRANCALALGQLRPHDVVRDLALLLFDRSGRAGDPPHPDPQAKMFARKAAAQALALTCLVDAAMPLALVLTYPDGEAPEVVQECMQALVSLEDPAAVQILRPYLADQDPQMAAYAALMLAQTKAPEAAGLIRDLVERLQGDPLEAALLALVTLRTAEGRAALVDLAADPREAMRLATLGALAQARDDGAAELIARAAEDDPSPRVREAARALLGVE